MRLVEYQHGVVKVNVLAKGRLARVPVEEVIVGYEYQFRLVFEEGTCVVEGAYAVRFSGLDEVFHVEDRLLLGCGGRVVRWRPPPPGYIVEVVPILALALALVEFVASVIDVGTAARGGYYIGRRERGRVVTIVGDPSAAPIVTPPVGHGWVDLRMHAHVLPRAQYGVFRTVPRVPKLVHHLRKL